MVLGLLLSSNTYAQIILKKCNLSPNFGKVDVIVEYENNLVRTVNNKDSSDVNFFEIYKVLGDQFIFGTNWVGSSLIDKNENKQFNREFFENVNKVMQQDIVVDIKYGVVSTVFRLNPEYQETLSNTDTYKHLYKIYDELKSQGVKESIKAECKLDNNYVQANEGEKIAIQKSIEQKNSNSFSKRLWRAFVEVMEDNGKEYFNAAVDAYYGTGALKSSQHCVTTNVGGKVQIFCKTF